ncbi:MAG: ABC transporter permease [Fusobacteriota bacterium]
MLKKQIKQKINLWTILSAVFTLLIIFPNINIMTNLLKKTSPNWDHIKKYLLQDYIINSLVIILGVGILSMIIGVTLAWFITVYEFPGRKILEWGLILPLAIPPYIAAYTYEGIFNYTGPLQSFFRNNFGIRLNTEMLSFMNIRGAIFIFTFFLYPYVYIITKSFLEKQSSSLIEASRMLGRNMFEIFIKIIIPISRSAIIGGVSLVVLEVLNDYGVVKYFGVSTFSTAIFKTWFAMGDINSAVRLAAILMTIVFMVIILEKLLRGRKKYSFTNTKITPIARIKIKGIKKTGIMIYLWVIFAIGFIIPFVQLTYWSIITYEGMFDLKFIETIANSFFIAFISTILVLIFAIVISNTVRIEDSFLSKIYSKIAILGYSIPGAVIAIGVMLFFLFLDEKIYNFFEYLNISSSKLILTTSMLMLIFAYIIRFLAIGYNAVESGFEKVGTNFFEASRTMGMNITETFFKVDYPMIKGAVFSGFILVFVDILKELPLTLILRPFNFDTLATKAFEYADDEMIHEASLSSLIIIIISIIAIIFFYRLEREKVDKNVS